MSSMCSHKSIGCDYLPSIFLKRFRSFLSKPIMDIINRSFDEGIFPDNWKKSLITPIPKKKGCTELTNFRPISVLPSLSKIIERVAQKQLLGHLLSNDLISPFQSGFRQGHSTQDVLLRVIIHGLRPLT